MAIHESLQNLQGPSELLEKVSRFRDDLIRAGGSNLKGLLLYGGLARGSYHPRESDVNVVILLGETSVGALGSLARVLRDAWRDFRLEPFILTLAEPACLADVFPVKVLDIQRNHRLLFGEDPFRGLKVEPEHIRLHVEQGLRNLCLRLRRSYPAAHGDREMMRRTLYHSARPLALQLGTLLELAGHPQPAAQPTAGLYEQAAQHLGLDARTLAELARLRDGNAEAEIERPLLAGPGPRRGRRRAGRQACFCLTCPAPPLRSSSSATSSWSTPPPT